MEERIGDDGTATGSSTGAKIGPGPNQTDRAILTLSSDIEESYHMALSQVQIIQSLAEALSWFEKELNWGAAASRVAPPVWSDRRALCGNDHPRSNGAGGQSARL